MYWERLWWNDVHGPRAFIQAVTERIISGKSVSLIHSDRLPWREGLRDSVQETIEPLRATAFELVRAAEALSPGEKIEDYILRRFTNGEGYRPHAEKWWDYLRRTKALESTLLWLYDVPRELRLEWQEVYRRLKNVCLFIIELEQEDVPIVGSEAVDAGMYISEYDYLLLASKVTAERVDIPAVWRRYLSDIATQTYNGDAERVVAFAENYDPRQPLEEYDGSISRNAIWTAQLKNAYHLIEEERLAFVRRYKQPIRNCLPETQFGEEITDPYEAELGLLWHLTHLARQDIGKKSLIVAPDDYKRLYFLRDVRNKLAHHDTLSPQEMELLLSTC